MGVDKLLLGSHFSGCLCDLWSIVCCREKEREREREREFLLRKVELQEQKAMGLRKEQQLMWLQPWNLTKQRMEKATVIITS
ncbi:unnamed protein product [Brassica napus]|uniref:(rape) hypothetical protein n=1 Tax=Brassica napus TaxID=3708 RepID=A0A816SP27_BRANA|nr:unnamed protein product [Brassica napus]